MGKQPPPVGYEDTPMIPGQNWRVHDINRPQPTVVTPGSYSTSESPGSPPSDAVVLFDGTDLSKWEGKDGGPAGWNLEGDYFESSRAGNIQTKEQFGDCQLHIEWASPSVVEGASQGRGNSGVFLMGLYESQVLDGYDNRTYADGTTGAIYGQYPPLVNACRKPGEWQVYDLLFVTPKWDGDKLESPAYITLIHNGVLLHHHQPIQGPTGHKQTTNYDVKHGPEGPLMLQDHRNPVRYRNIWMRRLKGYDEA